MFTHAAGCFCLSLSMLVICCTCVATIFLGPRFIFFCLSKVLMQVYYWLIGLCSSCPLLFPLLFCKDVSLFNTCLDNVFYIIHSTVYSIQSRSVCQAKLSRFYFLLWYYDFYSFLFEETIPLRAYSICHIYVNTPVHRARLYPEQDC